MMPSSMALSTGHPAHTQRLTCQAEAFKSMNRVIPFKYTKQCFSSQQLLLSSHLKSFCQAAFVCACASQALSLWQSLWLQPNLPSPGFFLSAHPPNLNFPYLFRCSPTHIFTSRWCQRFYGFLANWLHYPCVAPV